MNRRKKEMKKILSALFCLAMISSVSAEYVYAEESLTESLTDSEDVVFKAGGIETKTDYLSMMNLNVSNAVYDLYTNDYLGIRIKFPLTDWEYELGEGGTSMEQEFDDGWYTDLSLSLTKEDEIREITVEVSREDHMLTEREMEEAHDEAELNNLAESYSETGNFTVDEKIREKTSFAGRDFITLKVKGHDRLNRVICYQNNLGFKDNYQFNIVLVVNPEIK